MLYIFDLFSRLMDHSTTIYPESTVVGNLAVMDFGVYVKASHIYTIINIINVEGWKEND